MRQFHSTSVSSVFQTYDINCSEYVQLASEVYAPAFTKFCECLEVRYSAARDFARNFIISGQATLEDPFCMQFTPNELDAIVAFTEFYLAVLKRESACRTACNGGRTSVFAYTNLNTGKGMTWVDFVS